MIFFYFELLHLRMFEKCLVVLTFCKLAARNCQNTQLLETHEMTQNMDKCGVLGRAAVLLVYKQTLY